MSTAHSILPDESAAAAAVPTVASHSSASASSSASHPPHLPALHWSPSESSLTHQHRMMSAAVGSFLTSLTMTPFDVVKTRLQAQINSKPKPVTASSVLVNDCHHYRLHTGLMDSWCANCVEPTVPAPRTSAKLVSSAAPAELRFTGAIDAAAKLVKHEGLSSLWRGLSPTILMAVPATVVYFSLYDQIKITLATLKPETLERQMRGSGAYASTIVTVSPVIAGVCARAVTTTLVSPIELVRTKSQASRTSLPMRALLMQELRSGGVLSLWRGVGPTLMRDVPFSAIYWTTYEYTKSYLLERWGVSNEPTINSHKSQWVYASFLAGAGSGMVSATITHPFDLIKTRRQIDSYRSAAPAPIPTPVHLHTDDCKHTNSIGSTRPSAASSTSTSIPSSTWQIFRTIVAEEGYVGLLTGLSARLTKIAPACAIMISSYEGSKMLLGERDAKERRAREQGHKYQQ